MLRNLEQIARRFESYPWYEVAVEVAVIWLGVFIVLSFLRGTRGAGMIKGFAFLLIGLTLLIRVFGGWSDAFSRLNFIYDRFLGLLAILLIVVFQPELRRAMMRLGETRLFRPSRRSVAPVADAIADAASFLSKSQFGALIAIERTAPLAALAGGGVPLDAVVSSRLLQSIFWPNNPIHDLGVVIVGDRILAAGVQFPLIDEVIAPIDLGSRHRAALGLSAETDAVVVVVSEETGIISIAERGRLERNIARDSVARILTERLRVAVVVSDEEGFTADRLLDSSSDAKSSTGEAKTQHKKVAPSSETA
ncbi:MAG: diadenylate cyclase [Phycisphaerales bacterium]